MGLDEFALPPRLLVFQVLILCLLSVSLLETQHPESHIRHQIATKEKCNLVSCFWFTALGRRASFFRTFAMPPETRDVLVQCADPAGEFLEALGVQLPQNLVIAFHRHGVLDGNAESFQLLVPCTLR